MVGLHLYNRTDLEGYYQPFIMLGEYPLIYYISFLFDSCVPIYCFCSEYAMYLMKDKTFIDQVKRLKGLIFNYWIVVILTCIVGMIFKNETIPSDLLTFIGNISLLKLTYVGAWWFIQIYILLVLTSKLIIKLINKCGWIISLFISCIIYLIAYYFRIMNPISFNNIFIDSIINISVLYGTSLLPFVFGILFKKYNVISYLRNMFNKSIYGYIIIFISLISHIIVKSMIVAPFVAIVFIVGYSLINIKGIFRKILLFFSDHSTNIWLTHMQFYMIFFSKLVFSTNTTIGCLFITLSLSILSSYLIKFIQSLICK